MIVHLYVAIITEEVLSNRTECLRKARLDGLYWQFLELFIKLR